MVWSIAIWSYALKEQDETIKEQDEVVEIDLHIHDLN